ncbi:hypothetical protein ACN42_g4926, partial [Penicillium freii]
MFLPEFLYPALPRNTHTPQRPHVSNPTNPNLTPTPTPTPTAAALLQQTCLRRANLSPSLTRSPVLTP